MTEKEKIYVKSFRNPIFVDALNLFQTVINYVNEVCIANITGLNKPANKLPEREVKTSPKVLQLYITFQAGLISAYLYPSSISKSFRPYKKKIRILSKLKLILFDILLNFKRLGIAYGTVAMKANVSACQISFNFEGRTICTN